MSYLVTSNSETSLSGLGCGESCGCAPCRSGSRLSETYVSERPVQSSLSGLAEPDDVLLQRSRAAIDAALKRNPVGGYTVGTAARRALEDAFKSVPKAEAVTLHNELNQKQTPLAKLFQLRLHPRTHQQMKAILQDKEAQWIDGLRREQAEKRQRACAAIKEFEKAVENLCKVKGEDSDSCQKMRFDLLSARERMNMQGARCP